MRSAPYTLILAFALPFSMSVHAQSGNVDKRIAPDRLLEQFVDLAESDPEKAFHQFNTLQSNAMASEYPEVAIKAAHHCAWWLHSRSFYDSSLRYFHFAARISERADKPELLLISLSGLGESFMRLYQGDSAEVYLTKALAVADEVGDAGAEAGIYNNFANVCLNENRLEDALRYFIRCAALYDSIDDQTGYSKALSNLGNVQYRLGHLEKAMDYADQSIAIARTAGHVGGVAYGYKLKGWIYRRQGEIDRAITAYDSALALYRKLDSRRDIVEIIFGLGNVYFDRKQFSKALEHYHRALSTNRVLQYSPFEPYCYSGLAYAYMELKNFKYALMYADSVEVSANEIKNKYLLMDSYLLKSSVYEQRNEPGFALKYLKAYQSLEDSLSANENRKAMEEAEAKYQNDIKQAEINRLTQAEELQRARLAQLRTTQTGIAIVLLLIIAAGLVVWNRSRVIARTRNQLEIERMRNAIARDLHDDIGSALSSINIACQIALGTGAKTLVPQLTRIRDQSTLIMERMSDIVWSINPENDRLDMLVNKMREFAFEVLEQRDVELIFDAGDLSHCHILAERRKNLFLIFKEAVNNIAKYANCSTVRISFQIKGTCLELSVCDNGRGFDKGHVRMGNGLRNMETRASALQGELHISSVEGEGTHVLLRVPIT